jgi:hypothetical protein
VAAAVTLRSLLHFNDSPHGALHLGFRKEGAADAAVPLPLSHWQGFLLDRGFQIFLTSYPEAKAQLEYEALDLQPFYAGADVRFQGAFHRVADPLRHPLDGLMSLSPTNPVLASPRALPPLLHCPRCVPSRRRPLAPPATPLH